MRSPGGRRFATLPWVLCELVRLTVRLAWRGLGKAWVRLGRGGGEACLVARLTQNQVDARVLHIRNWWNQNNSYTAMWVVLGSVLYLFPWMLRAATPRKSTEPKKSHPLRSGLFWVLYFAFRGC